MGDLGSIPGWGRSPWRRKWQPTPVFLPRKSHGWWSLACYNAWGCRVGHHWGTSLSLLHIVFSLFIYLAVSYLSCRTRDFPLGRTDSLVVVCGLSCPLACGILVPWTVIEPASSALQGRFLTTGPPGKPLSSHFLDSVFWSTTVFKFEILQYICL